MSAGTLRRAAQRACERVGRRFVGQPVHETHPFLLAEGELLPGMHKDEFAARRRLLSESMPKGSIALLPAARQQYVTGVIPHPYRQDADFLHWTGVQQPAVAIIGDAHTFGGLYALFLPPQPPEKEVWEGARMTPAAAIDAFDADEAHSMLQLGPRLLELLSECETVFVDGDRAWPVGEGHEAVRQAVSRHTDIRPLRTLLHHLRWVKTPSEIALLRASVQATCAGLLECARIVQPGIGEWQVAAKFEHTCKTLGASRLAFPSVVASGVDACTIHYGRNDKVLEQSSLLLMDVGCEVHGYCSDVTRTFPVGGRFSEHQQHLYQMVVAVHQACKQQIKPGVTMRELHTLSVRLLSEALIALQVAPGINMQDMLLGEYRRFYPHSVGHWIGMDVHDTSIVSHDRPLAPGVALTLEPGLYIPGEDRYGQFAGLGVRIEDDVLVTDSGCEVLSESLPVDFHDVQDMLSCV